MALTGSTLLTAVDPSTLIQPLLTSAASGAAAAVAHIAIDAIFEKKLDANAKTAITSMRDAITLIDAKAMDPISFDLFKSLRREDFGHTLAELISRQVFSPVEISSYVLQHQMDSTNSVNYVRNDPNLISAVNALRYFQGILASHLILISSNFFGNPSHSYVLLFLHKTLSTLIQKLSAENDTNDTVLTRYQGQFKKIEDAFCIYVRKTEINADDAMHPKYILEQLTNAEIEVKKSLIRCKANQTLSTNMSSLRKSLDSFANQLQRVLFAIVIEPGKSADCKLNESTIVKHAEKRLFLERLLGAPDKNRLLFTEEEKCEGGRTRLESRATGTIYKNPFYATTKKLSDDYKLYQTAANKEYEFCLYDEIKKPEKNKLYLRKINNSIEYTVVTPNGEIIKNKKLKVSAPEPFTLDMLNKLREEIIEATSEAGHTKKQQSLPTKKGLFLNQWLEVINANKHLTTPNELKKIINRFANRYNTKTSLSGGFSMLESKNKNVEALLKLENINVGLFLQKTMELFHQSTEFVNFINALTGFMKIVGKIGFYSNQDLHKMLSNLITDAQMKIEANINAIIACVNMKAPGGWLGHLTDLFKQINTDAGTIKKEMRKFNSAFNDICDDKVMQDEFKKNKNELMRSVVGLAEACGNDKGAVNQFAAIIGDKKLENFIAAPTPSVSIDIVRNLHNDMRYLIGYNEKTMKLNDTLSIEIKAANEVLIKAEKNANDLKITNEALCNDIKKQAIISNYLKEEIEKKDTLVTELTQDLEMQIKDQLNSISKSFIMADELINMAKSPLITSKEIAETQRAEIVNKLKNANQLLIEMNASKSASDRLLVTISNFNEKFNASTIAVRNGLAELQQNIIEMSSRLTLLKRTIELYENNIATLTNTIQEMAGELKKAKADELILKQKIETLEEAEKQRVILEQNTKIQEYKQAISNPSVNTFKDYLTILNDKKLDQTQKDDLLNQFPNQVKIIMNNLQQTDVGYVNQDYFTISTMRNKEKILYVQNDIISQLNSTTYVYEEGLFKLTLSTDGSFFEIVSKKYEEYPLFVSSSWVGGLVARTPKPANADITAINSIFNKQNQITLKPEGQSFIMSCKAWPTWTLFLEDRWDGRVRGCYATDPGTEGHFVFNKCTEDQLNKYGLFSKTACAPAHPNPSGVSVGNDVIDDNKGLKLDH